jgi:hypothetical protein
MPASSAAIFDALLASPIPGRPAAIVQAPGLGSGPVLGKLLEKLAPCNGHLHDDHISVFRGADMIKGSSWSYPS